MNGKDSIHVNTGEGEGKKKTKTHTHNKNKWHKQDKASPAAGSVLATDRNTLQQDGGVGDAEWGVFQ